MSHFLLLYATNCIKSCDFGIGEAYLWTSSQAPKKSHKKFSLIFAFSDLLNSILNLAERTFASLGQSVLALLLSSQNFSLSSVLTIMTIFQILNHSSNYWHVIKQPRTIPHRIPQWWKHTMDAFNKWCNGKSHNDCSSSSIDYIVHRLYGIWYTCILIWRSKITLDSFCLN